VFLARSLFVFRLPPGALSQSTMATCLFAPKAIGDLRPQAAIVADNDRFKMHCRQWF
jgi:hypothetical protein